jgi:hypothetical protein
MLLVAILVAVIWLPNIIMLLIAAGVSHIEPSWSMTRMGGFGNTAALIAIIGFTFFGIAWFFSATMKSPVLAACGGLIAPLLIWTMFLLLIFVMFLGNRPLESQHCIDGFSLGIWYCVTCLVSATVCFLTGTWVYLKRGES